jgi:SSS family solute:Na+ symporter
MAANFYQAIWAFAVCFCVTVVVTLFTEPRKEAELVGLVYSLTPKPKTSELPWYERPSVWAIGILALCAVLNVIFW